MNTLRVDATAAPPPIEISAVKPAPEPRSGPQDGARPRSDRGPDSATALPGEAVSANGPNEAELQEAAEELRSELQAIGSHSLDIRFEKENNRYVVQVLDRESGELIRQIPPENLLEASRALHSARGLLFDDRT